MRNFRAHKHKIISSKRDSQLIDQLQVVPLPKQHPNHLSNISPHHYRITHPPSNPGTPPITTPITTPINTSITTPITTPAPDPMSQILQMMGTLNQLQETGRQTELRSKLDDFKTLLNLIQDSTHRSHFYGEEKETTESPHSFESRSSFEEEEAQTERQGYELSDSQTEGESSSPPEIKYRRVDQNESLFDYQQGEEEQSSIIHLFSYQKDHLLETPLSSITERDSEYCSPDSKSFTLQRLEYKKIQYLLETSQKKGERQVKEEEMPTTSSRNSGEGSEEGRARSQRQLGEMISLLEKKYHRTISGREETLLALESALQHQLIRPRTKK